MRILRPIAVLALAASLAAHAEETTPRITSAALLERIEANDSSLLILDVRSAEEFAAAHIPGAINIPHTHLPARISDLPDTSGKDVVVYCEVGVRSEKAAATLKQNGFTRVLHLEGDIVKWRQGKRRLEK